MQPMRRRFNPDELRREVAGRCFVCEMLCGNPEFEHHVIYKDDAAVAFLSKYPQLYGYVIVAPTRHLEQVTGDFSLDEYLALQAVIHRVGEALRRAVPTERLYILSLGSQAGNAHVHWHVVPLPPGVPFEQQQYAALSSQEIFDLSDEEMRDLANRLRRELA